MKSCEQLLPMAVSALALCGLGVAAEVAAAEENPPLVSPADRADMGKEALPPQASISFPDRNIDDWRANGRKGLWIRAQRKWYYAELFMPCDELPWGRASVSAPGVPSRSIAIRSSSCGGNAIPCARSPPRHRPRCRSARSRRLNQRRLAEVRGGVEHRQGAA